MEGKEKGGREKKKRMDDGPPPPSVSSAQFIPKVHKSNPPRNLFTANNFGISSITSLPFIHFFVVDLRSSLCLQGTLMKRINARGDLPNLTRLKMPTFRSFCSSSAILLTILDVLLFTAQFANSSDDSFVWSMEQYAYDPISDTMLRSLLGYDTKSEQNIRPFRIFLAAQPPKEIRMENEKGGDEGAKERIIMAKRKNAELVNHILKNFASLNRLGDAGKK
ncbi:hypothetical protein niasHT_019643 [Heterodera trifolii]|uniref:Uncharacterized protein n=1 Tax=Heterodera trifolii TaxID=157864 RepID=A0ABD2L583_9BILA